MAYASYTTEQLVARVLKKLGVLASGQSASAEDAEAVTDILEAAFAEFAADGITYVSDSNAIEPAVFESLATLVAAKLQDDFGAALNVDEIATAEATLRRLNIRQPTYQPQNIEWM